MKDLLKEAKKMLGTLIMLVASVAAGIGAQYINQPVSEWFRNLPWDYGPLHVLGVPYMGLTMAILGFAFSFIIRIFDIDSMKLVVVCAGIYFVLHIFLRTPENNFLSVMYGLYQAVGIAVSPFLNEE